MVINLGYKKNINKMHAGGDIVLASRSVVKVINSRCDSVWPAYPDEVLDDYVVDVRDNIVDPQQ